MKRHSKPQPPRSTTCGPRGRSVFDKRRVNFAPTSEHDWNRAGELLQREKKQLNEPTAWTNPLHHRVPSTNRTTSAHPIRTLGHVAELSLSTALMSTKVCPTG